MTAMRERLIAGCMTGTSLDGIDAALIRVRGEGLDMQVETVRTVSDTLGSLGKLLRGLAKQRRQPIGDATRYSLMLGQLHAALLDNFIGDDAVDFVVVHGQTVYHEPPASLQLINPHPIAQLLGIPVAFDLRGADLSCGGQGAPITPMADYMLFADAERSRAVVNLGGFANVTRLPDAGADDEATLSGINGADVCTCNQLLDYVARRFLKKRYDKNGQAAAMGIVHPEAEQMLEMMLTTQAGEGRSLGTGDEAADWAKMFQHHGNGQDLAATACEVIGRTVAGACRGVDQIILAGGGARNNTLVDAIRAHADGDVMLSDELGVDSQYREAIAMAILGAASQDGLPLTLPQVTGRRSDTNPKPCWAYP